MDPITDKDQFIAEVKGGITPYLDIEGAVKAADFYVRAFGATIAAAVPPDETGRTMHVHLYLNGGSLMLSDPYPEYAPGGTGKPRGFNLTLQVDDIEAVFGRAVAEGCTVVMPVETMFWGARYGQVRDPFGVLWAFNQHI